MKNWIFCVLILASAGSGCCVSPCAAAPVIAFGDFEGAAASVFESRSTSFGSEGDLPSTPRWVGNPQDGTNNNNGFALRSNGGVAGSQALRINNSEYTTAANKFFYSTYQFIETGNVTGAFDLNWEYRRLFSGLADNDPIAANGNFLNVTVIGIDDTDAGSDWTVDTNDRVFNVEYFETSSATQASRTYAATGANISELASGGVGANELDNQWYSNTITFNLDPTIDLIAIAIDVSQPTTSTSVISYVDNVTLSSATAVPEPSSFAAFGFVSILVGIHRRRRVVTA